MFLTPTMIYLVTAMKIKLEHVRNALQIKNLVLENKNLKKRIAKKYEIVGDSLLLSIELEVNDKICPPILASIKKLSEKSP